MLGVECADNVLFGTKVCLLFFPVEQWLLFLCEPDALVGFDAAHLLAMCARV